MRLDFLHPALLGGLALAALPLLIHLISRRKARHVSFAALEFVLRSTRRQTRRLRLRQLLLLLLRTLVVALVVLAASGPRLIARSATPGPRQPALLVLCVDASASMQAQPGGARSLFADAQARARRLIRSTDATVPIAVYLAKNKVTPLVEPATLDRARLLQAVDQAQVSDESSDLVDCVAEAQHARAPGQDKVRLRLVVISDGAAHAWSSTLASAEATDVELERVPAADAAQLDNHALRALHVELSPRARSGHDVGVEVQRWAAAEQPEADVDLMLQVGQRPLSRVTAAVLPGAVVSKSFMQVELAGPKQRAVVVEVQSSADDLAIDDIARLPVELPRPVRVLIVDGDAQTVSYRDEIFYLERALSGQAARGGRLQNQVRNLDSLRADDLSRADVVVLANVAQLPSPLAAQLVRRVRGGAGLLITAGDHLDAEAYNVQLAELLPGALRGAKTYVPLDDPDAHTYVSLTITAATHPIFAAQKEPGHTGLEQTRTHSVLLIDPASQSQRRDLLRFDNGAPALTERRVGEGRVLLLCTSVDRDWSDLAIRPGFVPLMQQSLLYLARALRPPRRRVYTVGEAVQLAPPRGATQIELRSPSGRTTILDPGDASFEGTNEVGLYRVRADLGAGLRPLPAQRFVVEVDPRESRTELVDVAELRGHLPDGVGLRQGSRPGRDQRPLWTYLLIALVLGLLAESIAARRGG